MIIHPELGGLLVALAEQPGDHATRLILADWLEDHGNSRIAAVLRDPDMVVKLVEMLTDKEPYGDMRWSECSWSRQQVPPDVFSFLVGGERLGEAIYYCDRKTARIDLTWATIQWLRKMATDHT